MKDYISFWDDFARWLQSGTAYPHRNCPLFLQANLDFYEFVTDEYLTLHLEHNFNGRIFSRIPFLKKLNWREIIGFRGVVGDISDENRAINASGLPYNAPNKEAYYEYSFGIANIFKVFRIDFNFRGNYLDNPDARKFGVTGAFGFYF